MKDDPRPVRLKLVDPFEDAVRFAREVRASGNDRPGQKRAVNISILLPTRGRAAMLGRLLESIAATAADPEGLEVVLYLDEDDGPSCGAGRRGLDIIRVVRPRGRTMGEIFRECYLESSGRYLMLMNDDALFTTAGWDSMVIGAFEEFSDGVALVYGDDLDQGRHRPTFPILSRECCVAMGGVVPAGYRNLHIESHIFDVFRRLALLGHDRIRYLEGVRFEHLRYSAPATVSGESHPKDGKDMDHDTRLFIELEGERARSAGRLLALIEKGGAVSKSGGRGPIRPHDSPYEKPVLSIILPVGRDNIDLTRKTLDALLREEGSTPGFEILLVSSAPETLLPAYALEDHERFKVIRTVRTAGEASAFNLGAREAAGRYLLFIGGRTVPAPGLASTLVLTAETIPGTGIVGCKQVDASSGRIHHAGVCVYEDSGRLKRTNIYRGAAPKSPQVDYSREFDFVNGECMLVRRSDFSEAGGFDEGVDGMFDMDLCFKVRLLGKKVLYAPEAVAVIYPDPSAGKDRSTDDLAEAGLKWAKDARCDLEEALAEDGFVLQRSAGPKRYEVRRGSTGKDALNIGAKGH